MACLPVCRGSSRMRCADAAHGPSDGSGGPPLPEALPALRPSCRGWADHRTQRATSVVAPVCDRAMACVPPNVPPQGLPTGRSKPPGRRRSNRCGSPDQERSPSAGRGARSAGTRALLSTSTKWPGRRTARQLDKADLTRRHLFGVLLN